MDRHGEGPPAAFSHHPTARDLIRIMAGVASTPPDAMLDAT
jgi:hypothetical protein